MEIYIELSRKQLGQLESGRWSLELPEEVIVPAILTDGDKVVTEVVPPGTEAELVIEKFGDDPDGNEILMYKFKLV